MLVPTRRRCIQRAPEFGPGRERSTLTLDPSLTALRTRLLDSSGLSPTKSSATMRIADCDRHDQCVIIAREAWTPWDGITGMHGVAPRVHFGSAFARGRYGPPTDRKGQAQPTKRTTGSGSSSVRDCI